jgi:predicted 3-demethylubiquinone-9 3-methyltransferase (glyoxalase superfamily)
MAQKITPNLWFDTQAEEAAEFYCSVFENSRIISKTLYPEGSGRAGTVVTVEWELDGDRFVGINGGPQFKFDEAISLSISCEDQDGVDYYWQKLSEEGEEGPCGWLKGPLRPVLAGRPKGDGGALQRPRSGAVEAGVRGDADDEEAGHPRPAERGRRRPGALAGRRRHSLEL